MMYRNTSTGKTWDITDAEILKRIQKRPDYEIIEEVSSEPKVVCENGACHLVIDEELPFVPDENEIEPVMEEPEEVEPIKQVTKKVGGRSGKSASKTKK